MSDAAMISILGFALFGNLVCGAIGFAAGIVRGRQMGPTRTIETYEGDGVPF